MHNIIPQNNKSSQEDNIKNLINELYDAIEQMMKGGHYVQSFYSCERRGTKMRKCHHGSLCSRMSITIAKADIIKNHLAQCLSRPDESESYKVLLAIEKILSGCSKSIYFYRFSDYFGLGPRWGYKQISKKTSLKPISDLLI